MINMMGFEWNNFVIINKIKIEIVCYEEDVYVFDEIDFYCRDRLVDMFNNEIEFFIEFMECEMMNIVEVEEMLNNLKDSDLKVNFMG